jgi:hypothetical protein
LSTARAIGANITTIRAITPTSIDSFAIFFLLS